MNEFKFERYGAATYLVYEMGEDRAVDSMSLGMLTNNRIPGLAQASFTQMNQARYMKYNVSAKLSAEQIFARPVTQKHLLGLFDGVVTAMLSAEDYMIDPETILLDMRYIFSDVATGETVLICLPIVPDGGRQTELREFFRSTMFTTQFSQKESCDYVAKLMSYLNDSSDFSVADFKHFLDSLRHTQQPAPPQPVVAPEPVPAPAPVAEQPAPAPRPAKTMPVPTPVPPKPTLTAAPAPGTKPGEKEISLFYLLQHYNKDNAAAYKAQKAARAESKQKAAKPAAEAAPKKSKKKAKAQKDLTPGFAVPGQPAPVVEPLSFTPEPRQEPAPYVPRQAAVTPIASVSLTPPSPPETPKAVDLSSTACLADSPLEDCETVIMGQEELAQRLSSHLIRKRNGERITVDKAVFYLGRDAEFNDYVILDNTHVGHCHCHIVTKDGEYFIVDDNSKNHTSVNGEIIVSGVEVKLAHDFCIKLADEEFEFKLY